MNLIHLPNLIPEHAYSADTEMSLAVTENKPTLQSRSHRAAFSSWTVRAIIDLRVGHLAQVFSAPLSSGRLARLILAPYSAVAAGEGLFNCAQ